MSLYKRGGVYHYDFTVFGRRYRGSTHKTDVAVARRFERDLIGKTEQGLEPKTIRRIPALREAAERFLALVDARANRTSATTFDSPFVLYWTYEDIGTFLFVVVSVNALIRLAARLHLLNPSDLVAPRLAMQALIIVFLGLALYAILKFRYHRPVIAPLGWLIPSKLYVAISILGGVIAGLAITYFTHLQGQVMPAIPAKDFFVLGLFLGPVLEESVFRGFLLPVLARALGSGISVLATSVLFAAFHAREI